MGDLAASAISGSIASSLASACTDPSAITGPTVSRPASTIITVHAWVALTIACTCLYWALTAYRLAIRPKYGRTTATTRLGLCRLTETDGLNIRPTMTTDGLAGDGTGCRLDYSLSSPHRLDSTRLDFT